MPEEAPGGPARPRQILQSLWLAIFFWIMQGANSTEKLGFLGFVILLFSFELCQPTYTPPYTQPRTVTACYFLLNYAPRASLTGLGRWLVVQLLAIFFWIMPAQGDQRTARRDGDLLFSFELCKLKNRFYCSGWDCLCFALLFSFELCQDWEISKTRAKRVLYNLLFSFELCSMDQTSTVDLHCWDSTLAIFFWIMPSDAASMAGEYLVIVVLLFSFELCFRTVCQKRFCRI